MLLFQLFVISLVIFLKQGLYIIVNYLQRKKTIFFSTLCPRPKFRRRKSIRSIPVRNWANEGQSRHRQYLNSERTGTRNTTKHLTRRAYFPASSSNYMTMNCDSCLRINSPIPNYEWNVGTTSLPSLFTRNAWLFLRLFSPLWCR